MIGVISASQRIFQITKPKSTQTSSWGMYDISSIEKKVRAVVTMEFRTELLFRPVTHKKSPAMRGLKIGCVRTLRSGVGAIGQA